MIFTLNIILGVITGIVHLYIMGFPNDPDTISSILMLHQFVLLFGDVGIVGFFSNIAFAEKNARYLGWPGGPWQIKYGFSQIAIGVLGIMCIWFRGGFWTATLITWYMYSISGTWSHFNSIKMKGKKDKTEIAMIIVTIIYAIYLTILSINIKGFWTF